MDLPPTNRRVRELFANHRVATDTLRHFNRNINTARLALMAHPLVPSWDTACALLDDLLAANRKYLPQFA